MFDRVCFWLERMWRYKHITKELGDYIIRKYARMIQIASTNKKKAYNLIVGEDFIRLEFIISLEKAEEFYRELQTLNYYFEGALTPLLWKLNECYQKGDCKTPQGTLQGLYHTINAGDKIIYAIDFIVKGEGREKHYQEIDPLRIPFKGVHALDRFKPEEEQPFWKKLLRVLGR